MVFTMVFILQKRLINTDLKENKKQTTRTYRSGCFKIDSIFLRFFSKNRG